MLHRHERISRTNDGLRNIPVRNVASEIGKQVACHFRIRFDPNLLRHIVGMGQAVSDALLQELLLLVR